MGTIQKHYDIEAAKAEPSQLLLTVLSSVLERGTLTREQWRLSGIFTPKKDFLLNNPGVALFATCSEVVQYFGLDYIQVMDSGIFRYNDDIKGRDLEEVENDVWNIVAEKFWCDKC